MYGKMILSILSLVFLSGCKAGGSFTQTGRFGSLSSSSTGATLAQKAKAIFDSKCNACHAFANSTDMVNLGLIVPGDLANSKIYQRLINDTMPQGGPALDAASKQVVFDWISSGAPALSKSQAYYDSTTDQFYIER